MGWIERFSTKTGITSKRQFVIIMIVFACTGSTILFLKRPLVAYFSTDGEQGLTFTIIYFILILPIYYVFLLFYGFIFGEFQFFWNYVKRMGSRFRRKKNDVASEQGN